MIALRPNREEGSSDSELPSRGRSVARLVKGLGWLVLVAWAAVTIAFILSRIVPADPARLAAGLEAGSAQVQQLRVEMGLDDPVPVQYVRYLGQLVQLDFGVSLRTRQPVLSEMAAVFPATLELIVVSFFIYAVLGVVLGVIWAYWPDRWIAWPMRFLAATGAAVPVFWVGLLFQIFLAARLGWFPIAGNLNYAAFELERRTGIGLLDAVLGAEPSALVAAFRALALPVLTIVVSNLALTMSLAKTSLQNELKRPYIRAARASGIGESRIVVTEALRNALNPVITMLGLQLGWSLGGVIIVEVIFSWPGLGLYAFNAFASFDYNVIMAVTVVTTVGFVAINSLVNLLYPVLDPRLKV